jgi:hypothetical protein
MLHFLVKDSELFILLFIFLFITMKTHIVKQLYKSCMLIV